MTRRRRLLHAACASILPGVLAAASAAAIGCRGDEPAAKADIRTGAEHVDAFPVPEASPSALTPCPCLVKGAATRVEPISGGLVVTVKAEEVGATDEIRARARLLARLAAAAPQKAPDACPIVAQHTTLHPQEVDGGVAILVLPREASELSWLQQETQTRLRGMTAIYEKGAAR